MLRKLLFIAFAIILFGFLAKTYHLEDAQIIILSQQIKVSINFIVGILMVVIAFTVIHYLLRVYQFIRTSPSHWKKYRHDKTINKRQKAISCSASRVVNGSTLGTQIRDIKPNATTTLEQVSNVLPSVHNGRNTILWIIDNHTV